MNEDPKEKVVADFEAALQKFSENVVHDRQEWDVLVGAQAPERAALLKELTAFSELWAYFDSQRLPLPSDIVGDLTGIESLPIPERVAMFREINQRLLARVPHVSSDNQSRM
jgi:hypothetical protein